MLLQFQTLLLVYSGIQILPGLVLGGCKCPGIYPFFSRFTGLCLCIKLFVVISDGSLHFCGISGDIPFIIFYCIYSILLFSLLLVWLVVYFVDLFKKPADGFIDSLKGFLYLYLLQFCSDLSYFLSSATF